jgi:hypothetical protein
MVKTIFSLIFFYFLAIIQTSFLVHYEIMGRMLNLVLISIILVNFFEKKESKLGVIVGAAGGFYLDIFSPYFPGLFSVLGIAVALLIRMLKPFFEIRKFVSFIIILFIALLFYEIILALTTLANGFYFNIFSLIYNFLVGIILYLLTRVFHVAIQKWVRK